MAVNYNKITPDLRTAYRNNLRLTPLASVRNVSSDTTWRASSLESLTIEHTFGASDSYSIGCTPVSKLTFSVLNTAADVDTVIAGTAIRPALGYTHPVWEVAEITQTQFNANKSAYWLLHTSGDYYVQCNSTNTFSSSKTYYTIGTSTDNSWFYQGIFYVEDAETEKHTLFTTFHAYSVFYSNQFNNDLVDKRYFNANNTYHFDPEKTPYQNMVNLNHFYRFSISSIGLKDTGTTHILVDNTMTLREVMSRIAIMGGCNIVNSTNSSGDERIICVPTKDTFDSGNNVFVGYYIQQPLSTTKVPVYTIPLNRVYNFSLDGHQPTKITFLQAEFESENEETEQSETVIQQYPQTEPIDGEVGLSFDSTFFNDTSALQQIFNRIATNGSYSYQGFSADLFGMPWIRVNNKISLNFYTQANTVATYSLRPFRITHTYSGAIGTTLSCVNITDATGTSNSSVSERTTVALSKLDNKIVNVKRMMTGTYGESTTASGTAGKKVYVPNFTLYDNQKLAVKFVNPNTANNPTLRVYWDSGLSQPATNAIPIYVNTVSSNGEGFRRLRPSDVYGWKANQVVVFTFFNELVNGEPAWLIETNLAANFIGVIDPGILRLSTQPDGEILSNGTHTDLGSNYIEIVRDAVDSEGNVTEYVDFKAATEGVTVGSNENHQVRILSSGGVRIINDETEMNLSDRLTLTSDRNVTYNVHNLPNNAVVLAAGFFNANQMNCTGITMYNNESTGNDFIWEKRANGHCSLKMI